ncbi:MAG: hypothetical protein M1839_008088 [Geoglossum umbratile]|nr:MAG: hypothetical protein M1839_008088 [Geoglossum umbratile]
MPPKGNRGKQKKEAVKTDPSSSRDSNGSITVPNWPRMQPLIPPVDLSFQTLLPNQIILIPNLFTATLCKTYVSFLSALPLTTTTGKPRKGDAARVAERLQIHDPAFAKGLWEDTALKGLVLGPADGEDGMTGDERRQLWGGDVGLNPNIRIYRYKKGQFFAKHYDESNTLLHAPGIPATTTWTLLLYLTTPESGGETVFHPPPSLVSLSPISVAPSAGMALLHRHGLDCLLHEGREVLQGEKWVLRSDLCVRR